MSNKRQFSDIPPTDGVPTTPSKRASGSSRLQNMGEFSILDFSNPIGQPQEEVSQHTPRKADNTSSLDRARPPLQKSTSPSAPIEFKAEENYDNPFWVPADQSGQETTSRTLRTLFTPRSSIDSPERVPRLPTSSLLSARRATSFSTSFELLTEQTPSSPTLFVLSTANVPSSYGQIVLTSTDPDVSSDDADSSSDDSDSSPEDTSTSMCVRTPTKHGFTPVKTVSTPSHLVATSTPSHLVATSTPSHLVATPTPSVLSPTQFLSSPSQAILEMLIPFLDEEDENDTDVGPQCFSRSKAIDLCREAFNCTPKEQQLEVLDHIALKIDCVLIAPCGWGKTLAYFLPMVYWPGRVIPIISPLIALMNDQRQKLVKANIPHIVLSSDNSDDINVNMIRRLREGQYRAVFMSPEIIFGDSPTSKLIRDLWKDARWRAMLLAIVIDEVHCIEKWGNKFRPEYSRLGELRIWSPGVPIVGVTATLTTDALTQTKDKLFLAEAHVLRVKDIPTNVRLEVHTQPKDAMFGHNRFLDKDKTIIYFERIYILIDVFRYLTSVRPELASRIGVYFSTLHVDYKEIVMADFVRSDLLILLATEAAGMGCVISDVVQVIQYGFPRDMPSLVQRFGRAARDPKIQGLGILYAPPIGKTFPTDKNVREYLRSQEGGCLWTLIDKLFENGPRTCNNSCSGCFKIDRPFPTSVYRDTKSIDRKKAPKRSQEEKDMALRALIEWRKKAFKRWADELPFPFGEETWFLPDNVANQLSQKFSRIRTVEEVKNAALQFKWTPFEYTEFIFDEVAEILDNLNNEIDACRGPNNQTITTMVSDQLKGGSDGNKEEARDDGDKEEGDDSDKEEGDDGEDRLGS